VLTLFLAIMLLVYSFVIAGRGLAYSGPQRWDLIVQCVSPGRGGVLVGVC